jgi:cyclopropane fatty-acyl-phospholipid synthase-like methyltransferase
MAVLDLVPLGRKLVLDIGCGAGSNARVLHQRRTDVDGVTMSEMEAKAAEKWCRRVYVHNCEAGLPKLSSRYDCVICSHVLEHIAYPQLVLASVREILEPGGVLIVALPNIMNYKYRFRILMGRFDYESGGIMDDSHLRWYTLASATRLLQQQAFRVLHAGGGGHFPLPGLRRLLKSNGEMSWIDRLACHYFPSVFGWQLLLVATPANQ